MKKVKHIRYILILCLFLIRTPTTSGTNPKVIIEEPNFILPLITVVEKKIPEKSLEAFLYDLGNRESSNNYGVVNKYGYMGKYQFGHATLKALGYKVTMYDFLKNPALQEEAMITLLKHNKFVLRHYIRKYEGRKRNGVLVTESGILAAAHLGGPKNVKRLLDYGLNPADQNGTRLTHYMERFSGYKLELDS